MVNWKKITWFPQAVPCHAFMVWLAFRDRLSTGDRMSTWDIEQCCMLCGEKNEIKDHLFFACPYSFTFWMQITRKLLGSLISPDWTDTVVSLQQPGRSRLNFVLPKMMFQTVIYSIWREQNSRRHGGIWITTAKISRNINKQVRNSISSLCYDCDHPSNELMRRWFEIN